MIILKEIQIILIEKNSILITGAIQYYAQLGFPGKGLVVCNDWDLKPFELLKTVWTWVVNIRPLRYGPWRHQSSIRNI